MPQFAKLLILLGIILILTGGIIYLVNKTPLGHIPGNIEIKGKNFQLYFPIISCIIISIILTIILNLFLRK